MNSTLRSLTLAGATLIGMTGVVLLVTTILLHPPIGDLVVLATSLAISGGGTLGLAATRMGLSRWRMSLRARLVLVSTLTALLALVNVVVTAVLMFLSPHDLGAYRGMLAWYRSPSVPSTSWLRRLHATTLTLAAPARSPSLYVFKQ